MGEANVAANVGGAIIGVPSTVSTAVGGAAKKMAGLFRREQPKEDRLSPVGMAKIMETVVTLEAKGYTFQFREGGFCAQVKMFNSAGQQVGEEQELSYNNPGSWVGKVEQLESSTRDSGQREFHEYVLSLGPRYTVQQTYTTYQSTSSDARLRGGRASRRLTVYESRDCRQNTDSSDNVNFPGCPIASIDVSPFSSNQDLLELLKQAVNRSKVEPLEQSLVKFNTLQNEYKKDGFTVDLTIGSRTLVIKGAHDKIELSFEEAPKGAEPTAYLYQKASDWVEKFKVSEGYKSFLAFQKSAQKLTDDGFTIRAVSSSGEPKYEIKNGLGLPVYSFERAAYGEYIPGIKSSFDYHASVVNWAIGTAWYKSHTKFNHQVSALKEAGFAVKIMKGEACTLENGNEMTCKEPSFTLQLTDRNGQSVRTSEPLSYPKGSPYQLGEYLRTIDEKAPGYTQRTVKVQ